MRLTTIKLSGFKSFAEPINFQLPGQRIAVVGPNGCGKSNIIDAVRWVLGESRASELRGESMQDVIFSGTDIRKPSSRASVELVFDNTHHRVGGQWNQYAEIAVKRVLTRDGNSSYMINGQVVRRRDVHDVFLGTGLGPRAYAIIGQGTISRIIESRPEEMRHFLEEAAGVSKYKERRRETENRLHDTHENLTRVEDILRELNSNIRRLEKQAEVAKRYKALQDTASRRQHQLWWLKQQAALTEQQGITAQIEEAKTALEGRMAEQRKIESNLETLRQEHYTAGDAVNHAQGKLYEASAHVGKLEAEIKFVLDGKNKAQQRVVEVKGQLNLWQERKQTAEGELEHIAAELLASEEESTLLAAQCEEDQQRAPDLEETFKGKQKEAAGQREVVLQAQQQIHLLTAEQRMMGEQLQSLSTRLERLEHEKKQLVQPNQQELQLLESQLQQAKENLEIANAQLDELSEKLPELSEKRDSKQTLLNAEHTVKTGYSARLEALKSLQERVQTDGQLQPWLKQQGLNTLSALWEQVNVQKGWEEAVESALRERLSALEVSELEGYEKILGDMPPKRLTLYSRQHIRTDEINAGDKKPLASMLKLSNPDLNAIVSDWLHGCWVAQDLKEALANRHELKAGEAYYLATGHSVTRSSISFYAADTEQAGMLARQQEIENLEKQIKSQALIVEQAQTDLVQTEHTFQQNSVKLGSIREEGKQFQDSVHTLQVKFMQLSQQTENADKRSKQLDEELAEVGTQVKSIQEGKTLTAGQLEELQHTLDAEKEKLTQREGHVATAEQSLNQGRAQSRAIEHRVQEAQFKVRTLQARQQELTRGIETAKQQDTSLHAEVNRIESELTQLNDGVAQAGLQDALEIKVDVEKKLGQARNVYEELTQNMRGIDEKRLKVMQNLEPMRQSVTDLQLKSQAAQITLEQYTQHLEKANIDLDELAESVAHDEVELAELQLKIDELEESAQALGAVNLAAFEELETDYKRKDFLDAQVKDLSKAIATLEGAIVKIDRQTRDLLTVTFNEVNRHFGLMFPELFGGGHAKLIMTGDEILNSGVQVMAQPPGKRNSTIHLLSGGEKALTAIALVFAIFQLNPAPFCLLDEVDAPLDDANTERYCKLVKKMSEETQFLFISHNKIAMEMAEQLIGVTMQEQGVSRIVAVDMKEAIDMASA